MKAFMLEQEHPPTVYAQALAKIQSCDLGPRLRHAARSSSGSC